MNRFEELEAFTAVVEMQGFSRAADKLGIAKSMISRRVSDLEHRLGVQLLQRTTRRQSLTEAGRDFYPRATQIVADLIEAEEVVVNSDCQISGKIKLALPLVIGQGQLAQPISRFLEEHPEIKIDIDLNDRVVDLIQENIDLAIRIGELEDSSLIARKLSQFHLAICASPDYLARFGEPMHPDDLSGHEVLVYSNVSVGRQWSFQVNGKRISPRVKYRVSVNNGEFAAAIACEGRAIIGGPLAYMQPRIESGELVQILQDYTPAPTGIYAVYPPGRQISRRVRMLSDALYEYFR
jgi:DNA-binding transcriptional LysR family regulator